MPQVFLLTNSIELEKSSCRSSPGKGWVISQLKDPIQLQCNSLISDLQQKFWQQLSCLMKNVVENCLVSHLLSELSTDFAYQLMTSICLQITKG